MRTRKIKSSIIKKPPGALMDALGNSRIPNPAEWIAARLAEEAEIADRSQAVPEIVQDDDRDHYLARQLHALGEYQIAVHLNYLLSILMTSGEVRTLLQRLSQQAKGRLSLALNGLPEQPKVNLGDVVRGVNTSYGRTTTGVVMGGGKTLKVWPVTMSYTTRETLDWRTVVKLEGYHVDLEPCTHTRDKLRVSDQDITRLREVLQDL
jgi:hypothetical protein